MYRMAFVFLALSPFNLYASTNLKNNIDLGVGFVGNLHNNEKAIDEYSESIGYELSLGYWISDRWILQTGGGKLNEEANGILDNIFLRSKYHRLMSQNSSIYVGAGISHYNESIIPIISTGINYHLNDNIYIDFGYQALIDKQYAYSVIFSLNYKPSSALKDMHYDTFNIPENTPGKNENHNGIKNKKLFYGRYMVVKGDNLTSISKKTKQKFERSYSGKP